MPLGTILRSSAGTVTPSNPFVATDAAGNHPQIGVQIDFDTAPAALPRNWTDVTDDVRVVSYTRGGRSHELQRTDAGTLTCVLDNRSGDYDPTNTGGSHYPNVKRMRWIRVIAKWAGVEYPRWAGLIEAWNQEWPSGGKDAVCVVRATDSFKILALGDLAGFTYPEQLSGERVAAVLADLNIPYSADTGNSTVVATDNPILTGLKALSHLQDVADTENGLLLTDVNGSIVFQDRHFRLTNASSLTSVATVGDNAADTGEIPYRQGELDSDDSDVWPTVSVTPDGGTPEVAYDAASRLAHYDRTLERTILSSSQADALAAAQWLSRLYADPPPRIPQVELLPQNNTGKWPTVLGLTVSDRLTWIRRAAATISLDVFVERISESASPGNGWSVSVQLSPASSSTYWVLEDSTLGVLDTSTVLAY